MYYDILQCARSHNDFLEIDFKIENRISGNVYVKIRYYSQNLLMEKQVLIHFFLQKITWFLFSFINQFFKYKI